MLVYWETTLACGLACRHCRATAQAERDPRELTTDEGYALLDEVTRFGRPFPHVVFNRRRPPESPGPPRPGPRGDGPRDRRLARARRDPAAHPGDTWRACERPDPDISLSLDGSDAERHDGFRMVPGTFEKTKLSARWARAAGMPIQVNTLVTDETLADLPPSTSGC